MLIYVIEYRVYIAPIACCLRTFHLRHLQKQTTILSLDFIHEAMDTSTFDFKFKIEGRIKSRNECGLVLFYVLPSYVTVYAISFLFVKPQEHLLVRFLTPPSQFPNSSGKKFPDKHYPDSSHVIVTHEFTLWKMCDSLAKPKPLPRRR